jgi:hypothetical protein
MLDVNIGRLLLFCFFNVYAMPKSIHIDMIVGDAFQYEQFHAPR